MAGVEIERAVEFDFENGGVGIERAVGNVDPEDAGELGPGSATDFAMLEFCSADDADAADVIDDAFDGDLFVGAIKADEIDDVLLLVEGGRAVKVTGRQSGDGAVERFGVFVGPMAEAFQDGGLFRLEAAVTFGSDVEEEVAAHAGAFGEHADALAGRFMIRVIFLVAPGVVDGDVEFPEAVGLGDGHGLFGRGVIAAAAHAAVEDDAGTPGAELLGEFLEAPLLGVALPVPIEPKEVGRITGAEFLQLAAMKFEKAFPSRGVFRALGIGEAVFVQFAVAVGLGFPGQDGRVIGMRPVEVGKIEADLEAVFSQRVAIGPDQVATGGRSVLGVEFV